MPSKARERNPVIALNEAQQNHNREQN